MNAYHVHISELFAHQALVMGNNEQSTISIQNNDNSIYLGRKIVDISNNSTATNISHLSATERLKVLFHEYRNGNIIVIETSDFSGHGHHVFCTAAAIHRIADIKNNSHLTENQLIKELAFTGIITNQPGNHLSTHSCREPDANSEQADENSATVCNIHYNQIDESLIDLIENEALEKMHDEIQKLESNNKSKHQVLQDVKNFTVDCTTNSSPSKKKTLQLNKYVEQVLSADQFVQMSLAKITKEAIQNFERAAHKEKERYREDSELQEISAAIRKDEQKKYEIRKERVAKEISIHEERKAVIRGRS